MSEVNVKTNRIVSTKWTYHKKRSFTNNYFFFGIFIPVDKALFYAVSNIEETWKTSVL